MYGTKTEPSPLKDVLEPMYFIENMFDTLICHYNLSQQNEIIVTVTSRVLQFREEQSKIHETNRIEFDESLKALRESLR